MNKKVTASTNISKMFITLSPIQALSAALPAINTLISSCIIGNVLGSSALASIGFVGPFCYIVLAFANLIGVGSQLLCSKHIGEGNKDKIKGAFSTTTIMCTVAGLFLLLISLFAPMTIAKLLGATGELQIMTADYIKGYGLCSMFTVFSTCVLTFLQLDCAKALSTASIIVQVSLNIGLNLINAFVLHWGMLGVGLASSIACAVAVLICVPHFVFKSKIFKFSIKDCNKNELRQILTLGWNAALVNVWLFLRDRIFTQVAFGLGGAVVLSAFTIANNISSSVGVTLQGALEKPCSMMSSVFVGGRDVESLRKIPSVLAKKIYPLNLISYALVFVFAKPICLFFGADIENIAVYVLAMRVFNLWILTNPLKTIGISIYNALGDVKALSVFNCLGLFVFPSLCMIFSKYINSISTLFAYPVIPEVLLLICFGIYYRMRTKRNPKLFDEFIYIPRTFTVEKKDSLALEIKNEDDVVKASEKVVTFCKEKGLDNKKSFYCGLCLEEMAIDKINNGFKQIKNGEIDVRLIYENGKISIMLRDNCPEFDPNKWLELYAENDPARSLGLKMVSKLSSEMSYKTTIGLNVLTIVI